MEDQNNHVHSDGCVCNADMSSKMDKYKMYRHHLAMKFIVGCIFIFMAFWFGVQMGEIKGALGLSPYHHAQTMMGEYQGGMQNPMMYNGAQNLNY